MDAAAGACSVVDMWRRLLPWARRVAGAVEKVKACVSKGRRRRSTAVIVRGGVGGLAILP